MTTYLITIVTLIKETKVDLFKSHLKQSNSLQQTSCILVQDKKEKFILFNFYCAKITLKPLPDFQTRQCRLFNT